MAIDQINGAGALPLRPAGETNASGDPQQPGFGDALKSFLDAVDGSAGEANAAVGRMLSGTGDVHEAMIALQHADVMVQLTVQVRNKLVQAYQDIMRMPV